MKSIKSTQSEKNHVQISSVLNNIWGIPFTKCIASSAEYIRSAFKLYESNGVKVVRGMIEGTRGANEFNSYDELFSALSFYELD